ncbi:MAG: proline iminopeptidase [Bacteroidetes bacterium GWF2_42_66]|nr:MAG: proline iminopeptidase [Bacteroidetes bacterium GWA2_42_15]OFY03602.1 MAG: proline iminopeptidase [Bacteroidetes bacterium GWE2_42_39]OFY45967.1 MAG: proline iminopeptidase [Bacteroidetes bacterium GWF2_42_66]HBL75211.1 proline iminopeptidase [Prolixibacteraceae bacterium]HCU59671.1 proline iminopeptidase [Prolixibacteraceae bacterium]
MFVILFSCEAKKNQPGSSVQEGFIQVDGGKVWYRIAGADKKGIPFLVLHGGPGAPHDYLETLEALADERPVIFYDQLGCGNSEKPSDTTLWTTVRFVEELAQVRAALKLDEVHILGQSWGTMLTTEYMLRKKPEGVRSLVLSGPYLSTPIWVADQQILISQLPKDVQDTIRKYEANGDYSSSSYQEAMMIFYGRHLCRLDPWPGCLNRTMEKMGAEVYGYMWGPSEFTMTGSLMTVDLTGHLGEITVPVLFTCGEYDEATPATTKYYQSKLPGSEIHIFEGASHSHHLEKMNEYNQLVRDFLKNVEKK